MIVHQFSNTDSFIFENYELPIDTTFQKIDFVNAHVTITSNIFKNYQFNESTDFELNSDSEFCERVLKSKCKVIFIPYILSKGSASYTCFFEKGVSVVLTDIYGNKFEIQPPKQEKKRSLFSLVSH